MHGPFLSQRVFSKGREKKLEGFFLEEIEKYIGHGDMLFGKGSG